MSLATNRSVPLSPAPVRYADWLIDRSVPSVEHKTGLAIRLERSSKTRKAFIDIQGIQKVKGTEWETKVNLLIEQGIFLIEKGIG